MSTEPRRIQRVVIDELFGPGSGTIDIALKLDQRVTILHGRNGSGKTRTLRLIAALREGQHGELFRYPFKRMRIETTDGAWVELVPGGEPRELAYRVGEAHGEVRSGSWTDQRPPESTRPRSRTWRAPSWHARDDFFDDPGGLTTFLRSFPGIKFIETDRLFRRDSEDGDYARPDEPQSTLMVDHLSAQVRELVQAADVKYRQVSTQLDSTLSQRIFQTGDDTPTREVLRARFADLRRREQGLVDLGLLPALPADLDEASLSPEHLRTFHIILADREQKLAPFDAVVRKASTLLTLLNAKLAPKRVQLDVERGYQVFAADGQPLALEQLSSGEQHELVLTHELLFDVAPGSLILVDEPELSLHVTWQETVVADFMDIAALSDLDFVLATHSPYIIGDHADLMVRLGDPA